MKKMAIASCLMLATSLISLSSYAGVYHIGMSDGTSGHPSMGNDVHYPTLWSGLYGYGTDYLLTYVRFDLSGISDTEHIDSIVLSGTANSYAGDSIINAYYVNDDTLGGVAYSNYTYNAFHTLNAYLGAESQSGYGPYSWNLSAYDYSADILDNTLTVGLTSDARTDGNHWVVFDRNLALDITTSSNVPEPATLGLLGIALAGLGVIRRKKQTHV